MKISELQITKDVKQSHADWKTIFEKNGWRFLGKGKDATVGQHPEKDYVVKVWRKGSLYEKFLPFVQAHQNNPHLPKFYRGIRPVPGTDHVYIRMEKLNTVYSTSLMSVYYPEMVSLYLLGLKYKNKGMDDVMDDFLVVGVEQHLGSLQLGKDYLDPGVQQKIWADIGAPDTAWTNMVESLIQYSIQNGIKILDLHSDNFMRRDRTLVIADPFYLHR